MNSPQREGGNNESRVVNKKRGKRGNSAISEGRREAVEPQGWG